MEHTMVLESDRPACSACRLGCKTRDCSRLIGRLVDARLRGSMQASVSPLRGEEQAEIQGVRITITGEGGDSDIVAFTAEALKAVGEAIKYWTLWFERPGTVEAVNR